MRREPQMRKVAALSLRCVFARVAQHCVSAHNNRRIPLIACITLDWRRVVYLITSLQLSAISAMYSLLHARAHKSASAAKTVRAAR